MKDPLFRRHLLLQILITLHALRQPNTSTPPKPDDPVLPESLLPRVQSLEQTATQLLVGSASDGAHFTENLAKLLSRERFWVDWKNGNCTSFERPVASIVPTATATATASSSGSALESSTVSAPVAAVAEPQRRVMGNTVLSRLWNQAGNFEHLENKTVCSSSAAAAAAAAEDVPLLLQPTNVIVCCW
jgi:hypothetical protein